MALGRRGLLRKILRSLQGTTRDAARTKQETGLGTVETLILDQIIDRKVEDAERGELVIIRKTPDGKYYLEKA
jgi:hypothetical protein